MAEPLSTEQQTLLKQHSNMEISKSTCKIITILSILFVILNIICIAILFSMVLEDDDDYSSGKKVAGTFPVVGPYSTVIEANGFLFISGQIAVVNGTIEGNIIQQTNMVLGNIKNILEDAGSNMNKVVKCRVFLTNISDFDAMNTVYMSYFDLSLPELDSYPARAALSVRDLPLGAQVEIEAIALT
eukprot:UN11427